MEHRQRFRWERQRSAAVVRFASSPGTAGDVGRMARDSPEHSGTLDPGWPRATADASEGLQPRRTTALLRSRQSFRYPAGLDSTEEPSGARRPGLTAGAFAFLHSRGALVSVWGTRRAAGLYRPRPLGNGPACLSRRSARLPVPVITPRASGSVEGGPIPERAPRGTRWASLRPPPVRHRWPWSAAATRTGQGTPTYRSRSGRTRSRRSRGVAGSPCTPEPQGTPGVMPPDRRTGTRATRAVPSAAQTDRRSVPPRALLTHLRGRHAASPDGLAALKMVSTSSGAVSPPPFIGSA